MIPNGIDPDDLQPHDDAELRRLRSEFAEPDESLVLLVGRLVYEKGFQFALEALPSIIERLPKTRFVVAGSGTHEEELRRQAEELGLMEHGTFVGWIGDDVLHSLYRIADVCVVPSIYEPFGLVALEAMASSCPCIVADTGGLREVVPHDEVGLRFRARDPESLAEMTVRVLEDARALPPSRHRGLRPPRPLRLGRRRRADRRGLRGADPGRARPGRVASAAAPPGSREVMPSQAGDGGAPRAQLRPQARGQRPDLVRAAADRDRPLPRDHRRDDGGHLLPRHRRRSPLVAGAALFASGKRL